MTVSELIEHLQKFAPDLEVLGEFAGTDPYPITLNCFVGEEHEENGSKFRKPLKLLIVKDYDA